MTTQGSTVFTVSFWRDAGERAIKSAAQAFVLAAGGTAVNIFSLDPLQIGGVIGSALVLSIATSLVSAPFSNPGTASLSKAVEASPVELNEPGGTEHTGTS